MNKKKTIIITGSFVLVLALMVLMLGLINIKPLSYFPEYDYFTVYDAGSYGIGDTAKINGKAQDGLVKTKYSVLHSMLEWRLKFKPYFIKDNDGEYVTITADKIGRLSTSGSGEYRLDFFYGETQELKVGKETVTFDRIIMFIPDGSGEIVSVRVIAYLDQMIGNTAEGELASENYEVKELRLSMNTTKLFYDLKEVFES